tara:strand:+ start:485 stop:595 length:111 start_codon:yes stop_codon:yes gene_type:complete
LLLTLVVVVVDALPEQRLAQAVWVVAGQVLAPAMEH